MDASEVGPVIATSTSGTSPRRRIETNRTMTPGGTFVTTTTTTTQRPKDHSPDAAYNGMSSGLQIKNICVYIYMLILQQISDLCQLF